METPNNKISGSLGAGSTVSVMSEFFSKPIEIPRPHMRVVDSDEVGLHQVTFSVIISIAVTAGLKLFCSISNKIHYITFYCKMFQKI